MSAKFDRLITLLKELFQLNQPDLDFGLYRIMHAKAGEVTQFLEKDLLPQVRKAFEQYQPADKAEREKELKELIADIQRAAMNPDDSPEVQRRRAELADAVDNAALEDEVFDHLYSFFRRYYSEGDFLSRRVYKPGVYAVPYEGEEILLHWANKDQYYIKTSEYLRDYAFRLKPQSDTNPMRVHFRLVEVKEGEHGNAKAAEGKDRVFILTPAGESGRDFVEIEKVTGQDELVIKFAYRPASMEDWTDEAKRSATAAAAEKPPAQRILSAMAIKAILSVREAALAPWLTELARPHTKVNGEQAEHSRLEGHLSRYTARHTFDYFIHKDLGAFLRRELDFYIKNEVMHLDDIESEQAPRVEQYLSKIKVIRTIAGKIIAFLAQLEDFQKLLWTKRKLIVAVRHCISLDRIPAEFYPAIAANDDQRREWVELFAIDSMRSDMLGQAPYTDPLTVEFLKANQFLTIDTRHFHPRLAECIVDAITSTGAAPDGLCIHADNAHALSLLLPAFIGRIDCVYIDPPYNTGKDEFVYKDNYRSSSWLCAIADRAAIARRLLAPEGVFLSSIADHEVDRMRLCLHECFGRENMLAQFVWHNEGNIDNQSKVKTNHEYILAYCKDERAFPHPRVIAPDIKGDSKLYNDTIENSITKNGPGNPPSEVTLPVEFPATFEEGEIAPRTDDWPQLRDRVVVAGCKLTAPVRAYSGWSSRHLLDAFIANECQEIVDAKGLRTWFKLTHTGAIYGYKARDKQSHVLSIIRNVGTVKKTSGILANMGFTFKYPKPVGLLEYLCKLTNKEDSLVLDYYAGSGTTAHAVLNLTRRGDGRRRYIVVDNGAHMESTILPRIRRVAYSPEWSDVRPVSREKGMRHWVKCVQLESYEDAIDNLLVRRTGDEMRLLGAAQRLMAEQYTLRYMLETETSGSPSLLNIQKFIDPTAYTMLIKRPGTDESVETRVDLIETFNWLIGLAVHHLAASQTFSADFERDDEGRLRLRGRRLRPDSEGRWWFRTVTGKTPDGKRTLVIWRKRPGGDTPEGIEQDNLVLDEWFRKQGYSTSDSEFDLIYVNGDNNLGNLRQAEAGEGQPTETGWKVRAIEEDFHRLMFDTKGT